MKTEPITPEIRRNVLDEAKRAHVGYIASALSIVELIAVLDTDILRIPDPSAPQRDRFVLFKGHAALALYAAQTLRGFISRELGWQPHSAVHEGLAHTAEWFAHHQDLLPGPNR